MRKLSIVANCPGTAYLSVLKACGKGVLSNEVCVAYLHKINLQICCAHLDCVLNKDPSLIVFCLIVSSYHSATGKPRVSGERRKEREDLGHAWVECHDGGVCVGGGTIEGCPH